MSLVLDPFYRMAMSRLGFGAFLASCAEFVIHLGSWKEGTFEAWDPWPAFVLYHVYWPLTILSAWWYNIRWSRVNVSTTKMFTQ